MAETAGEKVRHLDDCAGFSVADMTPLQKRPHVDHSKQMLEPEPMFKRLILE
jgi:hypothetical protein